MYWLKYLLQSNCSTTKDDVRDFGNLLIRSSATKFLELKSNSKIHCWQPPKWGEHVNSWTIRWTNLHKYPKFNSQEVAGLAILFRSSTSVTRSWNLAITVINLQVLKWQQRMAVGLLMTHVCVPLNTVNYSIGIKLWVLWPTLRQINWFEYGSLGSLQYAIQNPNQRAVRRVGEAVLSILLKSISGKIQGNILTADLGI